MSNKRKTVTFSKRKINFFNASTSITPVFDEPIRPPEAACKKVFLNERWLELNIGSITPTFLQEIFINYNQYTILERYLVNTKVETINIIIEVIIV